MRRLLAATIVPRPAATDIRVGADPARGFPQISLTMWIIQLSDGTVVLMLPQPLPSELVDLIARRFRVIGEPMRIRLLDRLREGEASVNELTEALNASQQNVSKHLTVLADAGILGRRKDGNHVYYRIVDESVFGLCEAVCGSLREQLRELGALIEGRTA